MKLRSVYARFYRSLNYDFIRASSENYAPDPWDSTPVGDYPFVRIRLRPGITTIVGANESGKSQVLRAVHSALTGEGYLRSDFCRYSRFFGIDKELVKPEFGAVFGDVTRDDVRVIESMSAHQGLGSVERVAFFHVNQTPKFRVYVRQHGTWSEGLHIKTPNAIAQLGVEQ